MRKVSALAIATTLFAACAHSGDMPTVRAGNDPDPAARARLTDRAAAAGGSHAPGGENFSGTGSSR